jgi:hypothetical protein
VNKFPPVRFRRPAGMLPLPVPENRGSIQELLPLPLLNLSSRNDFLLVVSWLLVAATRRAAPETLTLLTVLTQMLALFSLKCENGLPNRTATLAANWTMLPINSSQDVSLPSPRLKSVREVSRLKKPAVYPLSSIAQYKQSSFTTSQSASQR